MRPLNNAWHGLPAGAEYDQHAAAAHATIERTMLQRFLIEESAFGASSARTRHLAADPPLYDRHHVVALRWA